MSSARIVLLLAALAGCARRPMADTANANVPSDSTCEFVRVVAHPDPTALLNEFVARDARGEFTRASAWFDGAVSCPGHESAPDQATMARNPRTELLSRTSDTLRAVVTWDRLGYSADGAEAQAPGADNDTVVVLRTPYGWRVASPALNPHVPVPPPPRP